VANDAISSIVTLRDNAYFLFAYGEQSNFYYLAYLISILIKKRVPGNPSGN